MVGWRKCSKRRPVQVAAAVPQNPMDFGGDLSPKLDWEEMGDGSIVSSVSVTSPGASAMRMSIEVELPDAGELRFFDGQSNTGSDGSGYPVIGPIDLVPKNGTPGLLAPSSAEPEAAEIEISGQDDNGESPPNGKVYLTLAGGAAHMLTAQELEEGGDGIRGRFGDGAGRWRLNVSADQPLQGMSLMQSATGHLTNLSR